MTFDPEEAKKQYEEFMKDSVAAFAPGRIEFLGNHLDYNGGTVLGTAINAGIYGLAQPGKIKNFIYSVKVLKEPKLMEIYKTWKNKPAVKVGGIIVLVSSANYSSKI